MWINQTLTELGIVLDTTPQLGGDLDVNGNNIVSVSNGDILIIPDGTGFTGINHTAPLTTLGVRTATGPVAEFESTVTSGQGALLRLYANSTSPADDDNAGAIQFVGNTDDGAGGVQTLRQVFGNITFVNTDTGDAAKEGRMDFKARLADTMTTQMSVGQGIVTAINQVMGPTTAVTAATHTHAITERYLLCDTTSNAITVNLLAAATAGDGYRLDVKIVNATNAVTIDGSGSETIDGSTTLVLNTLYDNASLVCDGSNWHIL
jgi:hypothetical protein